MSYYTDFNDEQRQREYERAESHKININLWPDQMSDNTAGQSLACEFCSIVLMPSRSNPNTHLFCKGCGNETPINPNPPKVQKAKHMKPKKPGTGAPSLIIASQSTKRKKKPGTEGDLELRKDLALLGVIDDASVQEY